ncbi:MAG TPA: hypothetical protein VKD00_03955, partial [Methyloceanibacter sp.]|nr:hypothetical protein [Methyloceanibacter sp.]
TLSLFGIMLDYLAHDGVVNPHAVLLAVSNQRLRNFAVCPISKCVDCWHNQYHVWDHPKNLM